MTNMTDEFKVLSRELSNHYGISSVFLIAYDVDREEEIEKNDVSAASNILLRCKSKKGLIILEGVGGSTSAGQELGHLLRKQFHSQMVSTVPKIAGSALVYPIFYSCVILATEASRISPIDPYMYHKGMMIRCVEGLNHKDPEIRKKARQHFENTANLIYKFLSTRGCIVGRDLSLNEMGRLVKAILFTKVHKAYINRETMKDICFNVVDVDTNEIGWLGIEKLIQKIRDYIKENGLRGCILLDGKIKNLT